MKRRARGRAARGAGSRDVERRDVPDARFTAQKPEKRPSGRRRNARTASETSSGSARSGPSTQTAGGRRATVRTAATMSADPEIADQHVLEHVHPQEIASRRSCDRREENAQHDERLREEHRAPFAATVGARGAGGAASVKKRRARAVLAESTEPARSWLFVRDEQRC